MLSKSTSVFTNMLICVYIRMVMLSPELTRGGGNLTDINICYFVKIFLVPLKLIHI